ncbi:cadherin-related tumor suppressor-like [Ylistrum balloti]|uniref:cadherin-related tumor suppressor-like n=1 Tax=Ylistrum balloti TaxID=509963 RepID=UPI002905D262|nr:cadherin-related tumor suppressor-like [Ylistrum balloti]
MLWFNDDDDDDDDDDAWEIYNVYLSTNPGFEYDTVSVYTLTIVCTDQNGNAATDSITVNILPNTPPTISGLPTSITINEGTTTTTLAHNITVTDADPFTCIIGTTTPASAPFSILYGTYVYLDANAGLDQATTPQYTIPIVCSDNYGSSTETLTVNVSPNADPVITGLPVTVTVDETETTGRDLHTLVVSDPEGDAITCSVTSSPSGPFSILQNVTISEYILRLDDNADQQLNTAVATQHVLTITCSDSSGGTTSGTVYADVTGNTAPAITGLPDIYSVSENQNTEINIWALAVTDAELNTFVCSISVAPSGSQFDIRKNSTTGAYNLYILSNPGFNYQSVQSYNVTFTCVDSPQGASGSAVLVVDVIENRPPQFTNIPGAVSPDPDAQNTAASTSLFTVTATDADQDQVYFSMEADPTTDSFSINTDLNTAPTITNLVLNSVTSVSFLETTSSRTVIYTLNINDPDSGQTQYVTFDTTPAASAGFFNLTNNVVSLSTSKRFNYEDQTEYTLDFYVTDSIHTTGPYYLRITILEVGERCSFDKTLYEASVYEGGIGSGTIDLGFLITDPDDPDSHTYSIRSGTDAHLFAIGSATGIITFAVNYDYDTGSHPQNASIVIECVDTFALTGSATVSIYVNDINDNAPDFAYGGLVVEANQNHRPGDLIQTISATDLDSGNNAEIEYTGTSSTGESYYRIAKNGQILLLTDLTFDYGTTHRFYVTAVDHGSPQRTGTTYVDIVYRYVTTTTPTTTTTTLAPTDFWTAENIALIASLATLALLGLLVLLFMLLRNAGCCSGLKCPT